MGTQFTRYADQQILMAVLKGVALPATPAIVGLLKYTAGTPAGTVPTRDNVEEVRAADHPAYNRKDLGNMTLTQVNGQIPASLANDTQILWDEATTDWGNIVGCGIYDARTNGNLWICTFTPVAQQRIVRIGDRLAVPVQQIIVSGGNT